MRHACISVQSLQHMVVICVDMIGGIMRWCVCVDARIIFSSRRQESCTHSQASSAAQLSTIHTISDKRYPMASQKKSKPRGGKIGRTEPSNIVQATASTISSACTKVMSSVRLNDLRFSVAMSDMACMTILRYVFEELQKHIASTTTPPRQATMSFS